MKRLSVVIANYNYDRFVGEAIDSALAIDWPDVEVVVVDDGSTDDSLQRIGRYGDRVRLLATENAGQRVAVNRGFELTTGEVVVFLDSDDTLPADLATRLASVWGPAISKVQFQMQRIDESGRPHGAPFPSYQPVPSPADIQRWAETTSAYPTPPGSANAYARWFLERLLPIGPEVGDFADSALLASAPFLGEVVSLPGVMVGYRRHGANDSNLVVDPSRFPREVARARARWQFARSVCGCVADESPLFRSRELLQMRVASSRLMPADRPLPGDGWPRRLANTLTSPFRPGPERLRDRLAIVAWCLATMTAPLPVARRLVALRYR